MLYKLSRPQAFFFGAGSVLSLSGNLAESSFLQTTPDEAIGQDFVHVGEYLYHAMEQQPVQPLEEVDESQLEFAGFPA